MPAVGRWPLVAVVLGAALVASLVLDASADRSGVASETTHEATTALDGAVRAVAALGSEDMYASSRRGGVLPLVVGDAALRTDLDRGYRQAGAALGLDDEGRSPVGELVARAVPLGAQLLASHGDRAVVEVWVLSVLGVAGTGSPSPVRETWSTDTLELERASDGWRVLALSSEAGPTPVASTELPSSPDKMSAAARRLPPLERLR